MICTQKITWYAPVNTRWRLQPTVVDDIHAETSACGRYKRKSNANRMSCYFVDDVHLEKCAYGRDAKKQSMMTMIHHCCPYSSESARLRPLQTKKKCDNVTVSLFDSTLTGKQAPAESIFKKDMGLFINSLSIQLIKQFIHSLGHQAQGVLDPNSQPSFVFITLSFS